MCKWSASGGRAILTGLFVCLATLLLPVPSAAQNSKTHPPKQDEVCLACHGQPGFKSDTGKNISIHAEKHAASPHGILGCQACHTAIKDYPHPARIPRVECSTCHAGPVGDVQNSMHAALGDHPCASCHGDPHEVRPGAQIAPAKCAECHAQAVQEFQDSVHGQAVKEGDPFAPTCASCHGPAHKVQASSDPASMVVRRNLADTCASCHSNKDFLSRHRFPVAHPVEQYKLSVHARAVAAGKDAATCSSCHGSHAIFPGRDARAKINHWNIAATCGQCHADIAKTYLSSVHGLAMEAGVRDAPVCSDCHGEHLILAPAEAGSPVNASQLSTVTCGRCHGDERLMARYNLPADRVPSYADSYHGLAMREGSQTVANCASCHGVHNIFPSSDPRSTVNAANLANTCGKCHSGAGTHFTIGPVHVQVTTGPAHPLVRWVRLLYWLLIPLVLGFMILHNVVDFVAKLLRRRRMSPRPAQIERMDLTFRIFHWIVMLSFPVLVFTGFGLRYPDQWWARPMVLLESHYAFRGALHRGAGVLLIIAMAYHVIHLALDPRDRKFVRYMLLRYGDFRDIFHVLAYNFGFTKVRPQFGRFNYAEKIEYWSFVWGTIIMSLSGFLLWFNSFTLKYFPKWALDVATAVHLYEAVLAALSIFIWHFYMVIFDPDIYPTDLAWLTGKVPVEHYIHTRPAYVQEELAQEAAAAKPEALPPAAPVREAPKEDAPSPAAPKEEPSVPSSSVTTEDSGDHPEGPPERK